MRRTTTRTLAWLAIAAQPIFVLAWLLAAALDPGYSVVEQSVADLGAQFAAHPWIVNVGFVFLGLSLVALAVALSAALPTRRSSRVAAALFAATGVGIALFAFLPIECSLSVETRCGEALRAGLLGWETVVHSWVGLIVQLTFLGTPFALAAALRSAPVAPFAFGAGLLGILIAVAINGLAIADIGGGGVLDRGAYAFLHLWVLTVAAGVLDAAREEERFPSERSNVPARDFFGREWRGEGEIVFYPRALWRLVRQRFRVERTTTWLSDRIWLVEDRSVFDDGRVYAMRRLCELETPERLRVTAGDLPDGAVFDLSEEGYRLEPYTLLAPLGPIGVLLRCHDHHRLGPDGELIDTVEIRCLGLRVGRIEVRARPVPAT